MSTYCTFTHVWAILLACPAWTLEHRTPNFTSRLNDVQHFATGVSRVHLYDSLMTRLSIYHIEIKKYMQTGSYMYVNEFLSSHKMQYVCLCLSELCYMLVKDISISSSDGTIEAAMQFAIYTNVIATQYAVGFYLD